MRDRMLIQYQYALECWITNAVRSGVDNLWDLVEALPGVDPSTTRRAAERLISESKIPERIAVEEPSNHKRERTELAVPGLPLPHPLAFDWRFTAKTAAELLERSIEATAAGETVALLGTPSVYMFAAGMETDRRYLLIDKNQSLATSVLTPLAGSVFHCRDVSGSLASLAPVQAVIADPPWYEDEIKGFLASSAQICAHLGMVYISFPPIGVRPGIREERNRVIAEAQKSGLRFVGHEPLALSYATPFFEHNALLAGGFVHISPNWRRGDLLLFQAERLTGSDVGRPDASEESWADIDILGMRVWVREGDCHDFADPRLAPVVEGDILPTVSLRDSRRKEANVWTTGNRIYRCAGPQVLSTILQALREAEEPAKALQIKLQRPLSIIETEAVSTSVDQVRELVQRECLELSKFQNG